MQTIQKDGKKYFLIPAEQFDGCESWEDFLDLQVARERRNEPTKDFREFLAEQNVEI